MPTFTVRVTGYRLSPRVDVNDTVPVFTSTHRSPHAAARKLASLIGERTAFAKQVRRTIPRDYSGRYLIETDDGQQHALVPFRQHYC